LQNLVGSALRTVGVALAQSTGVEPLPRICEPTGWSAERTLRVKHDFAILLGQGLDLMLELVGWVECNEPHHAHRSRRKRLVGLVSLGPPYGVDFAMFLPR
jgi:hypothetical protein